MTPPRPPRPFPLTLFLPALTLALALPLPACHPTPSAAAGASAAHPALLPARLVIHPLTRIAPGPDGAPALIAHVELRDRFDQNTRALGTLRIWVDAPGDVTRTPARSWLVDLRDPDRNALLFDDLVTRTYTLTLTDPPQWLIAWSRGESLPGGPPALRAEFTFPGPAGTDTTLSDTATLAR